MRLRRNTSSTLACCIIKLHVISIRKEIQCKRSKHALNYLLGNLILNNIA
jgi:hypothetical protein